MAPAPAAPDTRRGLNLGSPGAKEYLIIGGAALGLGLLYFWWKGRHPAAAPASSSGKAAPATVTGLNTASFSAWIHDHTSSPSDDDDERRRRRREDDDDDKTGSHKRHEVTVPDVVGERYMTGSEKIADAGLIAQRSSPFVGYVRSQSPHAGTKVRRNSIVTLRGKPWAEPDKDKAAA